MDLEILDLECLYKVKQIDKMLSRATFSGDILSYSWRTKITLLEIRSRDKGGPWQ